MTKMVWSKMYQQELSRKNIKVEQNADFHMELPKKSAWEKNGKLHLNSKVL